MLLRVDDFNPDTPQALGNLVFAAEVAAASYLSPSLMEEFAAKAGFEAVKYIHSDRSGTDVYLFYNYPNQFFIVFRGTELNSFDDWLTDLNIRLVRNSRIADSQDFYVHRGFLDAYTDVVSDLRRQMKYLVAKEPYECNIIGHSLGGALALLCGIDFSLRPMYHIKNIITFGQPRIGVRGLAYRGENIKYTRIVNGYDPIPNFPPETWQWKYAHIARPFRVNSLGETLYLGVDVAEQNFLARHPKQYFSIDHSIAEYSKNLKRALRIERRELSKNG